jgi:hypothetical protein
VYIREQFHNESKSLLFIFGWFRCDGFDDGNLKHSFLRNKFVNLSRNFILTEVEYLSIMRMKFESLILLPREYGRQWYMVIYVRAQICFHEHDLKPFEWLVH